MSTLELRKLIDLLEDLGLPVKSKSGGEFRVPEKRQEYRLLDLVTVSKGNGKYYKVTKKPGAKAILGQSGIYIWSHPNFGKFYVGIASKNNLDQRWTAHLNKLMGSWSAPTVNWKQFSDLFLAGVRDQIDLVDPNQDLKDIRLFFYPCEKRPGQSDAEFKKELQDLESRIIGKWNTRTNTEYNPANPSVTKNV